MSGLAGGYIDAKDSASNTPVFGYNKESDGFFDSGQFEIYFRHPNTDNPSKEYHFGDKFLYIYGSISSSVDDKFKEGFFEKPEEVVSEGEGTFLIVGFDAQEKRIIIATDKLGGRPCYYIPNRPVFSTSLSAVLDNIEPTVDKQAIADFLLLGHLWGTRTLISEVKSMRPASVYEFTENQWERTRYWKPTYSERNPDKEYLDELANRFISAVRETTSDMPNNAGLWLSGGLDSRVTAAALKTTDVEFTGYTYNANPPTGDNTNIANIIGDKLGVSVSEISLNEMTITPERIERLIDVCDGMVRWNTTVNLSPSYDVNESVLMEGVSGSLVGDHLLQTHFTDYSDPVSTQLNSKTAQSPEMVKHCLAYDVDPKQTLKDEVDQTNEKSFRKKMLDIYFQNHYSRFILASNAVIRDTSDDKVIYNDGSFLEWCSGLPLKYRKGAIPKTSIPTGTSRAKLGLTRRVGKGMKWVRYERTKLPPVFPYYLHIVGFIGNVGINKIRGKATYGSGQLTDFWLRNDNEIATWTREHLKNAAERELFSNNVTGLWSQHRSGKNLSPLISQITTIDWWLSEYVD